MVRKLPAISNDIEASASIFISKKLKRSEWEIISMIQRFSKLSSINIFNFLWTFILTKKTTKNHNRTPVIEGGI